MYETASVIVGLLYNFTNVKMRGPNKQLEMKKQFYATTLNIRIWAMQHTYVSTNITQTNVLDENGHLFCFFLGIKS